MRSIKIKLLAAFVVTFICLNAGGALCIAYCQKIEIGLSKSEHCPLKKAAAHCDRPVESKPERHSIDLATGEFDCCPMAVSFFAGPIEKTSWVFVEAPAAAATRSEHTLAPNITRGTFPTPIGYRGPPRIKGGPLHIKNRVLRI